MQPTHLTPDEALSMLLEGNRRYTSGHSQHPHQSAQRRAEVLAGQHPFAVVLCCADSRVAPEVFFDQGLGDLFVVRNAGNIVDDVVLGSIEYAVEHLGTPLVMVVGHTSCGAVTAAVQGGEAPGHIGSIIETLQPAVEAARARGGDLVHEATLENVAITVEKIVCCDPILAEARQEGRLRVVGAFYHLDTGEVELVEG